MHGGRSIMVCVFYPLYLHSPERWSQLCGWAWAWRRPSAPAHRSRGTASWLVWASGVWQQRTCRGLCKGTSHMLQEFHRMFFIWLFHVDFLYEELQSLDAVYVFLESFMRSSSERTFMFSCFLSDLLLFISLLHVLSVWTLENIYFSNSQLVWIFISYL